MSAGRGKPHPNLSAWRGEKIAYSMRPTRVQWKYQWRKFHFKIKHQFSLTMAHGGFYYKLKGRPFLWVWKVWGEMTATLIHANVIYEAQAGTGSTNCTSGIILDLHNLLREETHMKRSISHTIIILKNHVSKNYYKSTEIETLNSDGKEYQSELQRFFSFVLVLPGWTVH